ncbi:MAG TPA: HNH endonuclease signature motif containing protein [Burkholderiaceae bacterium]|nr:HNH endonuclease signature motif containing protein [Burkholderiaceae bacterium]
MRKALVLLASLLALGGNGWAKKGGTHNSHSGSSHGGQSATKGNGHHSSTAPGVQRDPDGKIHRSAAAKDDFKKSHPCPSTGKSSGACPGYVIDHVKPLKRGGADDPSNMQWQTVEAAKEKDKVE